MQGRTIVPFRFKNTVIQEDSATGDSVGKVRVMKLLAGTSFARM